MKILVVSEHFYPYGGAELSLWKLCGALTRKGHQIHVITARRGGEADYEKKDEIEISRPFATGNLIRRFIFALRLYPYLKRWLRGREIDIIYNLSYVPTLPATRIARKFGIPSVTLLGHFCGRKWFQLAIPPLALLNFIAERLTIRLGKHKVLVVQCQDTAEKISTSTSAEIEVICNTLLETAAINQAKERTDIKKIRVALGIENNELFLIQVGALIRTKNVYNLIKVLAGWQQKFKLILVGDGPERARIEKLIQRLGLAENILLLGEKPHDETLSIIRSGDALLLPSICEQMPNVVLEALALGRPVIATRVGGVPEIKSPNLHLVDQLEEISRVIDSGIKAAEGDTIMTEYSLDRVAEQYEGLFLRLTGSKMKDKQV
ncbi:MAG: glycosyltransferase family 1 protein [Dehalococcoidia bacterium]|nr:MAG: glycosyltransferase family 1 protein [Dehalococcoidia bacterium]